MLTADDFHLIESLLHSSATELIQESTKRMKFDPPASKNFTSLLVPNEFASASENALNITTSKRHIFKKIVNLL